MFDVIMPRIPAQQENRVGLAVMERALPEMEPQPQPPSVEEAQQQPPPQPLVPGLKPASKRFMKRNPLVFEGTIDPFVVEEWISMMEKIFEFVQIEETKKVSCAVYILRNDAWIWWDTVKKI